MIMYGGTIRTWNKQDREAITMSGCGYPTPIGRQECSSFLVDVCKMIYIHYTLIY